MSANSHNLKNIGLKATLPRLKILELFQRADVRHMSAEDVYKALLQEDMDIGLATVYRVLTQFEHAGLLERHFFESGKAMFELNEKIPFFITLFTATITALILCCVLCLYLCCGVLCCCGNLDLKLSAYFKFRKKKNLLPRPT